MRKSQKKPAHNRTSSTEPKKQDSERVIRKHSTIDDQQFPHLYELKEKGKRVLKKLIPNQPIHLLKKLVQMGADNLKKQILSNHKLLPALTTHEIISELVQQPEPGQFQAMNRELTNSMLFFHKKVNRNLENSQMAELVNAQTEKCYRHIPKMYFQLEMDPSVISNLLTRDKFKALELRENLNDHYDEVEFNVNQQVNYKMGIFMSFVNFLTNIGQMADLSITKIKGTRTNNIIIKEIVIQRAQRVNLLRRRKEEIEKSITALNKLKKMKKIENWFMSQVQAKGKITSLSLYTEYCELHTEIKSFCCPKFLCKFWDVTYYIQRGYQDSFCRSLKNYLGEIIILDEKQIQEIVTPNKCLFATVQDSKRITSLNDPAIDLDESFQLDEEEVELVSKHNIQREIVSIFKQGIHKCSYSTDQICQELKTTLNNCEQKMYAIINGTHSKAEESPLTVSDRKKALEKLTTIKYVRIVEQWSDRMKKVVKRQFAIIERALKSILDLQMDFPEKHEIISSYLMQIIYITFSHIDESLSHLITCKKFKQQQSEFIKQVLKYEQQWRQLVSDLQHSPHIWSQLQQHFVEEGEEDPKLKEAKIVEGLLGTLTNSRKTIIEIMINGYNSTAIDKLPLILQEEDWKTTSIPSRFHHIIGQVLYGHSFTEDLQKAQMKMLSSSLLLDKNSSSYMSQAINQPDFKQQTVIITNDQIPSNYPIKVTDTTLIIQTQTFKILNSSMFVIETIQGYLEWADQSAEGKTLQETILNKIMEYILMYNTYVKDLILNKGALNYGKIKSKSITGKHLLVAYSQLKLIRLVALKIAKRNHKFQQHNEIIKDRLDKNMLDVSKKFRQVLQLAIRQSINKLVVDPRKEISWPVQQSKQIVAALNRSCDYVKDILMNQQQINQFISVQWCHLYLQKIKAQYKSVYKQIMNSNGTRKAKDIDWSDNIYWKFKELEYVAQSLNDLKNYIPDFNVILEELQQERKKVECPN